jgi:4-amino-4-deoxy-L-arabinose transferase-like glycosyltransferase
LATTSDSLTPPPIYRRLLSGAPDTFRLSVPAALLVAGFGIALLGLVLAMDRPLSPTETAAAQSARRMLTDGSWLVTGLHTDRVPDVPPVGCWAVGLAMSVFGDHSWVVRLPSAVMGIAMALLVAAMATRWLGNRIGLLAGLVYLSSVGVLVDGRAGGPDALLALTVAAAVAAFGLGNAGGRRPLRREAWIAWVFYGATGVSFLLTGPVGPIFILGICILYLYLAEDPQGLRFFVCPAGIAIFVLLAVAWPATIWIVRPAGWDGHWQFLCGWFGARPWAEVSAARLLPDLALLALPWTPFVLVAGLGGLWQGHTATPAWRLFGSWAAAPLGLMAAGLFREQPPLCILLPPVVVMAATGVTETMRWARRSRRWPGAWIAAAWAVACLVATAALQRWGPLDAGEAILPIAAAAAGLGLAIFVQQRRYLAAALAALPIVAWIAAAGQTVLWP